MDFAFQKLYCTVTATYNVGTYLHYMPSTIFNEGLKCRVLDL